MLNISNININNHHQAVLIFTKLCAGAQITTLLSILALKDKVKVKLDHFI